MGHQFFERLAGKCVELFQFELSMPEPNLDAVADAGRKVVHNRVLQLYSSGDLTKVIRVVRSLDGGEGKPAGENSVGAMATALEALDKCKYPDEAQRIALLLMQRADQATECNEDEALRCAARFFAEQLSRVEGVFRLPRDGLRGTQSLIAEVASSMASRVSKRIIKYRQKDPKGWQNNRWRSPRALAKKKMNSEQLGNELDIGAESGDAPRVAVESTAKRLDLGNIKRARSSRDREKRGTSRRAARR